MKRNSLVFSLITLLVLGLMLATPGRALAEGGLTLFTDYPSQMIGIGETVSVPLSLKASTAQTIELSVKGLPDGWTASFHGGSNIVSAVYVDESNPGNVDLRLEPPADIKAGKYSLTVVARSGIEQAELPLNFTVQEKLPPRLSLSVDGLPTKRGGPTSTFNFTASLKNEGGEDLTVSLSATQPDNMQVSILSGGQDATEIQLAANETKTLTIKADPLIKLAAGEYPFTVQAIAGEAKANLDLTAQVVGEGNLTITTPSGQLSGTAYAGKDNTLKLTLTNDGTASLKGIALTSTEPNGWTVTFDQQQIAEIPAGQSTEVTATIKPLDKAVAGDYMVTINAQPLDSKQQSAQFRITVRTSTIWGVAGIGLIALAVAVVGISVVRFGRR